MKDRLLVEEGKNNCLVPNGNSIIRNELPHPIEAEEYVDKEEKIGLGPLSTYLKKRFDIEWNVEQK